MFFHMHLDPTRAYLWSYNPQLSIVWAIGLIPLIQPDWQFKGLQPGPLSDHLPDHSELSALAAVWEPLPGEALCILLGAVTLWGYIGFFPPSTPGTNIPGIFSPFVVSVTVADAYLPESHSHLTQMVAVLGRCPELSSASLVVCFLTDGLLLWFPVPHVSFIYQVAIKDGGTVPGGE